MHSRKQSKIAIIGGGLSSLLLLKEYVSRNCPDVSLDLFEEKIVFGSGMPFSEAGAGPEHLTNSSSEEIPPLNESLWEWLSKQPSSLLKKYGLDICSVSKSIPIPRLLLGQYLEEQFRALKETADNNGLTVKLHPNTRIDDVCDNPDDHTVTLKYHSCEEKFDNVIIAIGHSWLTTHETIIEGYFESPYPPKKLARVFNHTVGVRGSSLTAIDAIKTLAINNGAFIKRRYDGKLIYVPNEGTEKFKIVMLSRKGLLPFVRPFFEYPQAISNIYLPLENIHHHKKENKGYISLDYIFENGFKKPLYERDKEYYNEIKDMTLEEFIEHVYEIRSYRNPFDYFTHDLKISKMSVEMEQPMFWKEVFEAFIADTCASAKHMTGEDNLRLRDHLLPLAAQVIAFIPHEYCEQLIALYDSGKLELLAIGKNNRLVISSDKPGVIISYMDTKGKHINAYFETFVDSIGQLSISFEKFPFRTLVEQGVVSHSNLKFKSTNDAITMKETHPESPILKALNGSYEFDLPGVAIDDHFHVIGHDNKSNPRISIMAIPYMAGAHPGYSTIDFCKNAANTIMSLYFEKNVSSNTIGGGI